MNTYIVRSLPLVTNTHTLVSSYTHTVHCTTLHYSHTHTHLISTIGANSKQVSTGSPCMLGKRVVSLQQ